MPPPTRPAAHAGGSFVPPVNGEGEPTLSTLARLVQQQSDVVSSQAELIGKLHESLRTLRDSSTEESEASRARIEALETRLRPLERLSQRTTALEVGADRMADRVESLEAALANAVSQKKELERKMNELDLRARVRETRGRPDVLRNSAAANAGPAAPSQAVEQVRAAESRASRRTPESSTSSDVPLRLTMRGTENQRVPPQSVQPGDAARTSQPGAAQASQPTAATRLSQPIAAAQPFVAPQTAATLPSAGGAGPQPCFTRLEFTAASITERSVPSAFAYHHEEHAHAASASPSWTPTSSGYSPPSPAASPVLGGNADDAMQLDDVASNAAAAQVGLGLDLQPHLSAPRETLSSQAREQDPRSSAATGALAPSMPHVRVKMEPGLPSASPAREPAASPSPSSQLRALTTLSEHNADSGEAHWSRDQDVQMSPALSDKISASERFAREQRAGASVARSTAATAAGSMAQGTKSPAQVTTSSTQGAISSAPGTAPSLEQAQTPAQTPARPSLASRAVSTGRKRTHDGEQAQRENDGAAAAAQPVVIASPVQMGNGPRIKAEPEDDEVSFVSEKRPVKTAKALRAGAAASPIKPESHSPAASQGRSTGAAAPASTPPTAPASLHAQEVSSRATPPRPTPAAAAAAQTAPSRSASHIKTPSVARTATASLPQRPQRDAYGAAPQSSRAAQVPEAPSAHEAVAPQARRASDSVGHSPVVSEAQRTRTHNSSSRDNGEAQARLAEATRRTEGPRRAPDDATASSHQADPRSRSPLPLSGYASVPFNESLKRPDLCWADVRIGWDDWRIGIDFAAQYNSISPDTLECLQEKLGHTIKTKQQGDLAVCELNFEYDGYNGVTRERSVFRYTHTFRILNRLAIGLILLGGGHAAGLGRVKKNPQRFFIKKCPFYHFALVLPDAPPPRPWVDYSVFKAPAGRAPSPEASTSASPASLDSQSGLSSVSTPPHPTAPLAQRLVSTTSAPQGPAAERTSSAAAPVSAATASLIARLGPPEPKRRKP